MVKTVLATVGHMVRRPHNIFAIVRRAGDLGRFHGALQGLIGFIVAQRLAPHDRRRARSEAAKVPAIETSSSQRAVRP
jgi:hypothetical protein